MPPLIVFYSWQSDLPDQIGQRFLRLSLEEACATVADEIGRAIEIDSGTNNVPGTPPVNETILRKIRACDIFVGDMSVVAATTAGKLAPNPNVMAEYGYALRDKGSERILLAMNTAFGPPKELPFDLHHLRHSIEFDAPETLTPSARKTGRAKLARHLAEGLRVIIRHIVAPATSDPSATALAGAAEAVQASAERIGRHDVPAIVPPPRLQLFLAPATDNWNGRLKPSEVVAALRDALPEGFDRADEGASADGWWLCDPPVRPTPILNPETRWYVRIDRSATLDASLSLGPRLDKDVPITLPGRQLEAMAVDLIDRASLALGKLGFGPVGLLRVAMLGGEDFAVVDGRSQGQVIGHPSIDFGTLRVDTLGARLGDGLQPMFDRIWMASGHRLGSPSFDTEHWLGYEGGAPYRI